MFTTVLIANRGEIALRVPAPAASSGPRWSPSTPPRTGIAARIADQAVFIGRPRPHSYLNVPASSRRRCGPGPMPSTPDTGSCPRTRLRRDVRSRRLTFVGPPPEVMHRLGDKSTARAADGRRRPAPAAGARPEPAATRRRAVAEDIGYPVIVKAVAGGGGRGMPVVWTPDDLPRPSGRRGPRRRLSSATTGVHRAVSAAPRGTSRCRCSATVRSGVHLGQRDCSVQRRHRRSSRRRRPRACGPSSATGWARRRCAGRWRPATSAPARSSSSSTSRQRFYFMEVNCPDPGGAPGHGDDHRRRSGPRAAADRGRRAARYRPGGHPVRAVRRSNAGSTPRIRPGSSCPTPGRLDRFVPPAGPWPGSTRAARRARGSPALRLAAGQGHRLGARPAAGDGPDGPRAGRVPRRGPRRATNREFLHRVLEHPDFRPPATTRAIDARARPRRSHRHAPPTTSEIHSPAHTRRANPWHHFTIDDLMTLLTQKAGLPRPSAHTTQRHARRRGAGLAGLPRSKLSWTAVRLRAARRPAGGVHVRRDHRRHQRPSGEAACRMTHPGTHRQRDPHRRRHRPGVGLTNDLEHGRSCSPSTRRSRSWNARATPSGSGSPCIPTRTARSWSWVSERTLDPAPGGSSLGGSSRGRSSSCTSSGRTRRGRRHPDALGPGLPDAPRGARSTPRR